MLEQSSKSAGSGSNLTEVGPDPAQIWPKKLSQTWGTLGSRGEIGSRPAECQIDCVFIVVALLQPEANVNELMFLTLTHFNL